MSSNFTCFIITRKGIGIIERLSHSNWFYFILSFVMMDIAYSSLTNMVPWVDEVMFTDTPIHYVKGMGWTTHAWYSVAHQDPFLLYPPLYSMVMVLWMNIFGTTLIACRSLNLVVMLLIGCGLLRICRQMGIRMSLVHVSLLIVLLWRTDDMINMYSNGRPDLLGAAILVFIVGEMIHHRPIPIILLSALLFASGIQTVVYLFILLLLTLLLLNDYREEIKTLSVLSALGTLLGFLLVCAFMGYHDHLTAFVVNALSYSTSLMKLAMVTLPVLGDYLGFDTALYVEKIAGNTTDVPFYSRILEIYTHSAYVSLVGVAIFAFFSVHRKQEGSPVYSTMIFLFAVVLSIPLLMNLAGRFPTYYYWMAYLPLFLLVIILTGLTKGRRYHCIIGLFVLFLVIQGCVGSNRRQNYSEIERFMDRCTMLRNKSVVAPFSVFYEMERLSSDTYYLGVYPSRYLPHDIHYMILPQRDSDYGANRLYDYYDSINKSDSLQTVMVAESKAVGLKVFKILRR